MVFGTWNVRSLLKPGAFQQMIDELVKYQVKITALQEIRWPEGGTLETPKGILFYSPARKGEFGVGFMVLKEIRAAVMNFQAVNERICVLRVKARRFNITFINLHAPTEEKDNDVKEEFYNEVERVYDACPKHDIKIVLGDLNAKIGKEDQFREIIGKQSLHKESNDNGLRVIDFATSKDLRVGSVRFPHKTIHKGTWISPDGRTTNQIDHILINSRHLRALIDVRSMRGANTDSDTSWLEHG